MHNNRHRQGQILEDCDVTRPLNPRVEGSRPSNARIQCNPLHSPPNEDTPLQRPRPPERKESVRRENNQHQENGYRRQGSQSFGNPWKRASMLWQSVPNNDPKTSGYPVKDESKRRYSCKEIVCICLLPCLLIALLLVAISIITTYFTVTKVRDSCDPCLGI